MYETRRNLATLLDDLRRRGDEPAFAVRTPYRRFTWSADRVWRASTALAARLREAGAGPGERVILTGHASPEWVAAILGTFTAVPFLIGYALWFGGVR